MSGLDNGIIENPPIILDATALGIPPHSVQHDSHEFKQDISPIVNVNFVYVYDSNEYTLAFHPSFIVIFLTVEESQILIIFPLFDGFTHNVNVPFPNRPVYPLIPVYPVYPVAPISPV